jgi:S1-C subfamily serine protease
MTDAAYRSNRREWAVALAAAALLVLLLWLAGKLLLPALRRSDEPTIIDRQLGATVERLDPVTAHELGDGAQADELVVTSVAEGGPADRAGVRAGDVIESVAGKPARSVPDLASAVVTPPTRLIVDRGGEHVILMLPGGASPGGAGQGRR